MSQTTDIPPADQSNTRRQVVWDAPIRVFHWLLVASFATAWYTAENDRLLHIHVLAGYLIVGLVVFRIVWGFSGSHFARFSEFVTGWPQVKEHALALLQRRVPQHVGHNPLAGWAVLGLLGLSLSASLTGVMVLGLEEGHGPLFTLFDLPRSGLFRELHEVAVGAMLTLVPLHIMGVFIEGRMQRAESGEGLIPAMIHGHKWVGADHPPVPNHRKIAALVLGLSAALIAALVAQGYRADGDYVAFVGRELPQSELYNAECGDCHMPYHPSLLPARSWQAMMATQDEHFGEDLFLEPDVVQALTTYALTNAAETGMSEPAYKINRSIPAEETPLRITETPYFVKKHEDIARHVWNQSNVHGPEDCQACHRDALAGTFEDSSMRLPDPPDPATTPAS